MRHVTAGRTVAALSTLALPLLADVPAASATDEYNATFSREHQFVDVEGNPRTCAVFGDSHLLRDESDQPFSAAAFTRITDAEPGCQARLQLEITYRQQGGGEVHTSASAGGASGAFEVDWGVDGVEGGLVVRHTGVFTQCSSSCRFDVTTSPK